LYNIGIAIQYCTFMIMIPRQLIKKAKSLLEKFPILTITGPRQSGKTTLIQMTFKMYDYYSLENPDDRRLIDSDTKGFLENIKKGVILDEVQKMPELFSYIQTFSDNNPNIKFILSGSQNFQLLENISQTLAGRTGILRLLPFSFQELKKAKLAHSSYEKMIFYGGYPRIYDQDIHPTDFYPNYIQTYIERDVRQIKNISDLNAFMTFTRLCAGRVGQLVNLNSMATVVGITVKTAKSWLGILESSYIVYTLKPYHKNYNKRMVKMPKLYFYDTGLACSLLGIENEPQLSTHYQKGELFENLVLNELLKFRYNQGKTNNLFFWRNNHGNEVDCIVEKLENPLSVEIKSSATYRQEFIKNLDYWNKISDGSGDNSYLIYTGNKKLKLKMCTLLPWNEMDVLLKLIS